MSALFVEKKILYMKTHQFRIADILLTNIKHVQKGKKITGRPFFKLNKEQNFVLGSQIEDEIFKLSSRV